MHQSSPYPDPSPLRGASSLLWRRKGTLLACWLTATALGLGLSRLLPPVYVATAKVLVDTGGAGSSANAPGAAGAPGRSLDTHLAVLRTGAFTRRAAAELGGDPVPPSFLSYSAEPGSSVIDIHAESRRPRPAAEWANAAARAYVAQVSAQGREALDRERGSLQTAVREADADLRRAEDHLLRFKKRTLLAGGDQTLSVRVKEEVDLAEKARAARSELISIKAKIAAVRGRLAQLPKTVTETLTRPNPQWETLTTQLTGLKADRARLLGTYTETSQTIQKVDAQIHSVEAALAAQQPTLQQKRERVNPAWETQAARLRELEEHRAAAEALDRQLDAASQRLRKTVDQLAPWQVQLARLEREVEDAQKTRADVAERLRNLEIRERALPVVASVVDPAEPPRSPVRPRESQQVLMAMLIGLLCGVGLAFLQESRDDRVENSADLSRLTHLPTLGVLPSLTREEALLSPQLALAAASESYRELGVNLRYSSVNHAVQSLVVTSPEEGEDRASTCANLAVASALAGKRVILVDADFRHPSAHRHFGVGLEPGLSSVLAGRASVADALQPTPVAGLRVLSTGVLLPNLPELLHGDRMTRLIAELRDHADLVIVDAPPVLPVPDTQALARCADGVVLVVDAGHTRKAAVRHARDRLASASAPLLGMVLHGGDGIPNGDSRHGRAPEIAHDLRVPRELLGEPAAAEGSSDQPAA